MGQDNEPIYRHLEERGLDKDVLDRAITNLRTLEARAFQLSCVSRIGLVFQSQRHLLERVASGRRVKESEWVALATCALMVPNHGRGNHRQLDGAQIFPRRAA